MAVLSNMPPMEAMRRETRCPWKETELRRLFMSASLSPIVDIAISMSPDTGPSLDGCLLDTARVSDCNMILVFNEVFTNPMV